VIAGVLPAAHATDGGGSIRIPAAQCGLFGLKPSRGRISLSPDAGEGWGGLSIGHVVTRSVRDSALMLDCTAGREPGDPYAAPTPEHSFVEAISQPPKRLKIAMMLKDHRGNKIHPECAKAVTGAAKLCASLGHIVEAMDAPLDLVALRPMNAMIAAANTARTLGLRWKALGREPNAKDVESVTWAVYQRGLKVSGVEYVHAIAAVHAAGRKLAAFLANWDVLLTTTLPAPPPKLGYFDQNGDVQTFTERVTEYLSITPLHNATGTPAMSVPLHWTPEGLPVGVHFAGRYGEEAMLLRLAAQLEAAAPWFDRLPPL
jgi:Asp-tRNA(Asn)/Glu-tRNA(Gln) amidotransferase A subunit family amidase